MKAFDYALLALVVLAVILKFRSLRKDELRRKALDEKLDNEMKDLLDEKDIS